MTQFLAGLFVGLLCAAVWMWTARKRRLENDRFEERAQIDIDLYAVSEIVISILEVQKVQLTGTIEEANDSTDASALIN